MWGWGFWLGLSLKMQIAYIGVYVVGGEAVMGLAWLGRDSSQHAGAAQIPPPRCRQGPRALGSPTRPLPAPAHPCAAPPCLEAPLGATAKRCFFHPLSGDNRETVFLSPPEVPFR